MKVALIIGGIIFAFYLIIERSTKANDRKEIEGLVKNHYHEIPELVTNIAEELIRTLGITGNQITPTTHLKDDLGVDEEWEWVHISEFMTDITQSLITPEMIANINSFDDLVQLAQEGSVNAIA